MFVEQRGGHPTELGRPGAADEGLAAMVQESSGRAAITAGSFRDLGLSAETLAAVDRAGYTMPTPVQAGLIPRALAGVDVLGQARTGTGKTASFVLPILEQMTKPGRVLDHLSRGTISLSRADQADRLCSETEPAASSAPGWSP